MWRQVLAIAVYLVVKSNGDGFVLNDALRRQDDTLLVFDSSIVHRSEIHSVITKDGYKLKLFRILPQQPTKINKKRPPVYIFHGLLGSGKQWLEQGPSRSLPHILSDAGYDVWLGNARGTTFSRDHIYLSKNSPAYWSFSWHEIGIYDNPANINYILNYTRSKQIHYVGHSQGTTTFFVMCSLLPSYNKKIRSMHALSPVAFMKNTKSPAFTVPAANINILNDLAHRLKWYEILPTSSLFRSIQRFLCGASDPSMNVCHILYSIVGGRNDGQANSDIYQTFPGPAGASIFQLLHYAQLVNSGKFQTYAYSKAPTLPNMYNSLKDYPLHKVNASLFFHVGRNDLISNITDINALIRKLPRKPIYYEVNDVNWSHFDFLYAKNAKDVVYSRVLQDIKITDNNQNTSMP